MKKFLKIVMMLLVVIMLAIVAFIALCDPNKYRQTITDQITRSTGYHVTIKGDLRFHLFPKLSVLANEVTITAPGATEALAQADNMRIDIALWPLVRKELIVKHILIKNAIIRIADNTKPNKTLLPKRAGNDTANPAITPTNKRLLGINKIDIIDSVVILHAQQAAEKVITMRDITLALKDDTDQQISIEGKATINRDQQNAITTFSAKLMTAQPDNLTLQVTKLAYQLSGRHLPKEGIQGEAKGKVTYQPKQQQLALDLAQLTANALTLTGQANMTLGKDLDAKFKAHYAKSSLNGQIKGTLTATPTFAVELHGNAIDIDQLKQDFAPASALPETSATETAQRTPTPVKSANSNKDNPLAYLKTFSGTLTATFEQLTVQGLHIDWIKLKADNQQGYLTIEQLVGELLDGDVLIEGTINAQQRTPKLHLNSYVNDIDLVQLNQQFGLPKLLQGKLTIQGSLDAAGLTAEAIQESGYADFTMQVADAQLMELNLKQIIVKAVSLFKKGIDIDEAYEKNSQLNNLSGRVKLKQGRLLFEQVAAESPLLRLNGQGDIVLATQQCDFKIEVNILKWQGKEEWIEQLKSSKIPVHLYGPCHQLAYNVVLDKLLVEQAHNAVNHYLDKLKKKSSQKLNENEKESVENLLDKLNKKRKH